MEQTILRVQGLEKVYGRSMFGKGGFRAIAGVDLHVDHGSVFGLLGPNGAGKTTLIKVLLGLVRGHGGTAELFGKPVGDPASRKRVGYLPEAHRMPGYLTGRQVIELFGAMNGADKAWLKQRTPELLNDVGLTEFADKKVRTYSKGMQQRVGLAQALVHNPDIVFLDEPTDGVDPVGRMKIREMVQELKDRGTTVFINSHLLMEVEAICDRVVIMDKGKILREGTVAELTPDTGTVRFALEEVPDNLAEITSGIGTDLALVKDGFEVTADSAEQNQLIDKLRAAGVLISSIDPRKLTLEDSFIDMIRKERA